METKKENKKGFWASLFSPKSCACACGDKLIIEEVEKPAATCRCEEKPATDTAPQATTTTQTTTTDTATQATTADTAAQTTTATIKEIKILGPGCAKCQSTYQAFEKVIQEHHLDVKLTKVEDIVEIMSYHIMGTPAVVIDGSVKLKGHVPSESEIKQILGI